MGRHLVFGAMVALLGLSGCGTRASGSDGGIDPDGPRDQSQWSENLPPRPDGRPWWVDGPNPWLPDGHPWWTDGPTPWWPDAGPWPSDGYPYWPDFSVPWVDAGPMPCDTVCNLAIQCGTFTPAQWNLCQTWCSGMTATSQACVLKAAVAGSCPALNACTTPPPPPPPPPPQDCADICTYLTGPPCSLLPSSQYWTCYGACMALTAQQIQCAKTAKAAGQCMQVAMCIM